MRILAMWAFSVKPELERQARIYHLAIDSQLFSRKCWVGFWFRSASSKPVALANSAARSHRRTCPSPGRPYGITHKGLAETA
jgi:hypothetical protein